MNLATLRQKTGRLAMVTATTGFIVGLSFLNHGGAHAIGGLCNGRPASHTWLDASGQYHSWELGGAQNRIKVEVQDPLEGHLKLMREYSDADIHNVLSYLETLK